MVQKLLKSGENLWKLVKLILATIPQHLYICGILSDKLKFLQIWRKKLKLSSATIPKLIPPKFSIFVQNKNYTISIV